MTSRKTFFRIATPVILSVVLLGVAILFTGRHPQTPETGTVARAQPSQQTTATTPAYLLSEKPLLRPLPVSHKSLTHEWTHGDGSDLEVIGKLAHNPDEFIRMAGENERIKRRQLVYRRETAATVVQRARATGEPVRSLTLPGLDGREIHVQVTGSELAYSGLSGTFTGRVAGREQSIVTLAFKNNREAFSVSSPEDGLYLEAEPREPGEVIIKEIDPATYASGRCGSDEYHQAQESQQKSPGH